MTKRVVVQWRGDVVEQMGDETYGTQKFLIIISEDLSWSLEVIERQLLVWGQDVMWGEEGEEGKCMR